MGLLGFPMRYYMHNLISVVSKALNSTYHLLVVALLNYDFWWKNGAQNMYIYIGFLWLSGRALR